MSDTMLLLNKHKELINQDRLKETLAGVEARREMSFFPYR